MAVDKQASVVKEPTATSEMQKLAVDLFRYYNVPIDPETKKRLRKTKDGYVFEDTGAPFDPNEEGKMPRKQRFPVMFPEDILRTDNYPLQARTLKLKKYQDLVEELRSAVANTTSGVVNFVVGHETEMVDAILKCAFPPGAGVVYKGVDGYNINASGWGGDRAACGEKLRELLKGRTEIISDKDFEFIRSLSAELQAEKVAEGKPKPYSPLTLLNERLRPAMMAMQRGGAEGGGAPARAVGVPAGAQPTQAQPAQQTGQSPFEFFAAIIDSCDATISICEARKAKLERHDHRPADKGKASPAEEYRRLESVIQNMEDRKRDIKAIISAAWRTSDQWREPSYDGTGFIDFEGGRELYKRLTMLKDPERVYKNLRARIGNADNRATPARSTPQPAATPNAAPNAATPAGNRPRAAQPSGASANEDLINHAFDEYKAQTVTFLQAFKRNTPKELAAVCDQIIEIISKPASEVRRPDVLRRLSKLIDEDFAEETNKQDKVMILNNVDEGCGLVARRSPTDTNLVFTQSADLTTHFTSTQQRKKRAIVIVSRIPIHFGFDGVKVVPSQQQASMRVDKDEGIEIVKYYIEKSRAEIEKRAKEMLGRSDVQERVRVAEEQARALESQPGTPEQKRENKAKARKIREDARAALPNSSLVSVSFNEINRLGRMLIGRTQADAEQFIKSLFYDLADKTNGSLNGSSVLREATKRANRESIASATVEQDGEQRGLYRLEAKIIPERYLYQKRTDWGQHVESIDSTADEYRNLSAQINAIDERMRSKTLGSEERGDLENELSAKTQDATAVLNGIPHFVILYGSPGCGKSLFVEFLAKKLDFDYYDTDFGQTQGSLVGQSQRWFKALLDSLKRMSNVVIRIDEIDGQVAGSAEESRGTYASGPIKQLLSFLQDQQKLLQDNNIFIYATTNHPERIRPALRNRAEQEFRVPDPNTQENYEEFLKQAVDFLKQNHSVGPIFDPTKKTRTPDGWKETGDFINQFSADFPRMARAMTETGMNMRKAGQFLHQMLVEHMSFVTSTRNVALFRDDRQKFTKDCPASVIRDEKTGEVKGFKEPKVIGVEFTPDHFIRACQLTYPINAQNERITMEERDADPDNSGNVHMGINDLKNELRRAAAGGTAAPAPAPAAPRDNLFGPVMPEATDQTVASTDYYFEKLVLAGVVGPAATPAPAAKARENERQWLARIDRGGATPADVIDFGNCVMVPISGTYNKNA